MRENYIHVINTSGLITNLLGVVFLFRYGVPYRISAEYGDILMTSAMTKKTKKTDSMYKLLGFTGLILVVLGTLLQIAAGLLS